MRTSHPQHSSPASAVIEPASGGTTACQTIRPEADVYEAREAWYLVLEMPGVDEQGAEVSAEKNILTVTGRVEAFDTEGFERQMGSLSGRQYHRAFRLPDDVDPARIEGRMKNGVLQLSIPKVASALPQKVVVTAG